MMSTKTDQFADIKVPADGVNQNPGKTSLVSYSLPFPNQPLVTFLNAIKDQPRCFWSSPSDPFSFAGVGIAAKLSAAGPDRFTLIQSSSQDLFTRLTWISNQAPPDAAPRLFGGFSFQPGHVEDSVWDLFPDALFILPRFQLTQNNDQTWLTITLFLDSNIPTEEFNTHFTAYAQEYSRLFSTSSNLFNNQSHSRFTPLPYDDLTSESSWITAVSHALTEIESGSIEKVVLARARQLRMDKPFDPMLSLAELGRRYPECIQFFFEPEIGTAFYGATPELLAKTSEKTITTVALAGSIHRGETPTEDDFLAQSLMASSKDRHEHQVVVQSIKQRLAEFSTDIHISPNPEILKLNNIQHLQTNITARIKSQYNVLSAVNAMHPTPAVGGLPQQTALKIIKKIEPHTRGWYAAPIGWLSLQGAGEFAVAIRSAVTSGPLTRLYAGAGIVSQSDPHKEWHETALKFIPLMTALESAVAS